MNRFYNLVIGVIIYQVLMVPIVNAEVDAGNSFSVRKEEPTFKSGSVFINSSKKNDVLIKTNVWGAVQFPGVHYIPMGTRFLDAISFAGGPVDGAKTEEITLSTKPVGNATASTMRQLSIKDALAMEKSNPVLQPDDIIVVEESHSRDKIGLYLAIGTFLLSAAALGLAISKH